MKIKTIKYVLFAITFIYSSYWLVINLMFSGFSQEKSPITIVENQQIQDLILGKTSINIEAIKISESPHPFGMMIGIPTRPQLVLSRGLYDTFTPNAMEYVVLHEAGHYALNHGIIEFIAGLTLLILGIFILKKIKDDKSSLIFSVVLGIIFGVLMIQLAKTHELQADNYALKNIADPNGMIEATENFQNYHGNKYSQNKNPFIQFLFYRANPYENRIRMAEDEIKLRGK